MRIISLFQASERGKMCPMNWGLVIHMRIAGKRQVWKGRSPNGNAAEVDRMHSTE